MGGTTLPKWRPIRGGRRESKAGGCRASLTLKQPHSGWISGLQADQEGGNHPRGHSAEEQLLLSKINLCVCVCTHGFCVYTHDLCVHIHMVCVYTCVLCVCVHGLCVHTWFVHGECICTWCVCTHGLCVHGVYMMCVCVCTHRCMDLFSHKEYSSLCLHLPTSQTLRGLKLRSVGGCGF